MSTPEKAIQYFMEGFNCSQAVFTAFAEEMDADRELCLKISTAFGGGMSHLNQTCGAVTGALLALGLKYGRSRAEDVESKENTYRLGLEFSRRFKAKHGSLNCTDLIGFNLSREDQLHLAQDKGVFRTVCPRFVKSAAEIAESLIKENS